MRCNEYDQPARSTTQNKLFGAVKNVEKVFKERK